MSKETFMLEIDGVIDASDPFVLYTERLPKAKLVCLQHVSVVNEDSDSHYMTVGYRSGANDVRLATKSATYATEAASLENTIYLKDVDKFYVHFHNGSVGDAVKAWLFGYVVC